MTTAAITIAGGAWIFLGVIVVWTLAIIHSLYTRRGSGINQRPYTKVYSNAPGARGPSLLSRDESAAVRFTRGTR